MTIVDRTVHLPEEGFSAARVNAIIREAYVQLVGETSSKRVLFVLLAGRFHDLAGYSLSGAAAAVLGCKTRQQGIAIRYVSTLPGAHLSAAGTELAVCFDEVAEPAADITEAYVNACVRQAYDQVVAECGQATVSLVLVSSRFLQLAGLPLNEAASKLLGVPRQAGLAKRYLQERFPGARLTGTGTDCYLTLEASRPAVSAPTEEPVGFLGWLARLLKWGRPAEAGADHAPAEPGSQPAAQTAVPEWEACLGNVVVPNAQAEVLRQLAPEPYASLETFPLRMFMWRRIHAALKVRRFKPFTFRGHTWLAVDLGLRDRFGRCKLYAALAPDVKARLRGVHQLFLTRVCALGDSCPLADGSLSYFGVDLLEQLGSGQPLPPPHLMAPAEAAFDPTRVTVGKWSHLGLRLERVREALGTAALDYPDDMSLADALDAAKERALEGARQGDPRFLPATAWHEEHGAWSHFLPLYVTPGATRPELVAVIVACGEDAYSWCTVLPAEAAALKALRSNNPQAVWVFDLLRRQTGDLAA